MAHEHAHRLIYAADLLFDGCQNLSDAFDKAQRFLDETTTALSDTGIVLKGNTLFRIHGGYALKYAGDAGLKIFGDFKIFDVLGTCTNDFSWLRLVPNLEILTICERVPVKVFEEARRYLPNTVIAPVYPLTDIEDKAFEHRGEVDRETVVRSFFERVQRLPWANGVISAPKDLPLLPPEFPSYIERITPGIKDVVDASDTNSVNSLTIEQATMAGSTRYVIGSDLRKGGDLRGNVERSLDRIGEARLKLQHG